MSEGIVFLIICVIAGVYFTILQYEINELKDEIGRLSSKIDKLKEKHYE